MEVARLPDLSSMQVKGYVYDTEYGSLSRDMRCTIMLDALPGFEIGGRMVMKDCVRYEDRPFNMADYLHKFNDEWGGPVWYIP